MPINKKTPSQPPDWSKRLDAYFLSFARKTFKWSPAYKEALKRAFVEKRDGVEYYRCEIGREIIARPDKQVDHKEPVVPVGAPWDKSWDGIKVRMFVPAEKLQVLCKPCHRKKTNGENALRGKIWKTKSKRRSASRPV